MQTNQAIDKLKALYELSGWDIYLKRAEAGDVLGEVDLQPRFCEAVITVYADEIAHRRKRFPGENEWRVIEHEMGEIVVAECCDFLPEHITESDDFMRFRDIMADRIRRIVSRALAESDKS